MSLDQKLKILQLGNMPLDFSSRIDNKFAFPMTRVTSPAFFLWNTCPFIFEMDLLIIKVTLLHSLPEGNKHSRKSCILAYFYFGSDSLVLSQGNISHNPAIHCLKSRVRGFDCLKGREGLMKSSLNARGLCTKMQGEHDLFPLHFNT